MLRAPGPQGRLPRPRPVLCAKEPGRAGLHHRWEGAQAAAPGVSRTHGLPENVGGGGRGGGSVKLALGGRVEHALGGRVEHAHGGRVEHAHGGRVEHAHGGRVEHAHGGHAERVWAWQRLCCPRAPFRVKCAKGVWASLLTSLGAPVYYQPRDSVPPFGPQQAFNPVLSLDGREPF